MKLKRLFSILFVLFLTHVSFAQETKKITPELAAKAIRSEMLFKGVTIKAVGSGSDIMLEGALPTQEAINNLSSMAGKYSDHIFNLITVAPLNFEHELSFYSLRKTTDNLSSNSFIQTICEGAARQESWHILLSNESEKAELVRGARDFLDLKEHNISKSSAKGKTDLFSAGDYSFSLTSEGTGTGFIQTKLNIYKKNKVLSSPAFSKVYFSKPGEYIIVYGFNYETGEQQSDSESSLLIIHPQKTSQ